MEEKSGKFQDWESQVKECSIKKREKNKTGGKCVDN